MDNVLGPCIDLLLTVPFTASPTNAIEMNNAMTSSVDLGDNEKSTKAWCDHSCFIKAVFFFNTGTDITVNSRLSDGPDGESVHKTKSIIMAENRKS